MVGNNLNLLIGKMLCSYLPTTSNTISIYHLKLLEIRLFDLVNFQTSSVVTVTETGTETAVSTRNRTEPKPRFFAA